MESYLKKVGTEIREAVANGEMTPEEGKVKYAEAEANIKLRMAQQKNDGNARMESYLKKVGTEIREAVANGEMTPEEGKVKYAEAEAKIQQRMSGDKSKTNNRSQEYLRKIGTELRQSVANGEMTREEAKAEYLVAVERIKQRMAGTNSGKSRTENRERGGDKSSPRGK